MFPLSRGDRLRSVQQCVMHCVQQQCLCSHVQHCARSSSSSVSSMSVPWPGSAATSPQPWQPQTSRYTNDPAARQRHGRPQGACKDRSRGEAPLRYPRGDACACHVHTHAQAQTHRRTFRKVFRIVIWPIHTRTDVLSGSISSGCGSRSAGKGAPAGCSA